MLTYGDGVSNVDLKALADFHKSHGKIATITTVNLGQSKGVLNIDDNDSVLSFREKDDNDGALINGGFMVLNPEVFEYLKDDTTVFHLSLCIHTLPESAVIEGFHLSLCRQPLHGFSLKNCSIIL